MPQHTLTLLHVSDLHQRTAEASSWRCVRVLGEAWERNLDTLLEEGPVDLVCFTGDAAFSGRAEEYRRATEFFQAMLERLKLGWESLFSVPGNHDIDRKVSKPALTELDALLLSRGLRAASETAIEQGWLVAELSERFHLDGEQVARRLARSASWVSRRLALVRTLPESVQD